VRETDLGAVVREAIESVEPAAQVKGIGIHRPSDYPFALVSGDPGRLQQVIWNLLSNAIKFTGNGGRVQVSVRRANAHIELSVSDTGIGIPASFLPHVFDRFSQQDSSANRNYRGLGLGLAISKQLVELHGGSLHANSPGEGQGATFTMSLPIRHAENEQPCEGNPPDLSRAERLALPSLDGVRVLVVDDESDARDLIRRVLEEYGAAVTALASGEEALRILEFSEPQVLISDIGMPGMDGYQLMRRIRASEYGRTRMPAIALTAFARAEDRKRAILAGFQSHLAKPIDMAELVILVAGLAAQSGN
jgi:CheY-like chemotaxis protein/anti-sigma regulatory factor (Ser/Thr protein kinase)